MPGGRPPKYRKEFHPEEYLRLSKSGKTLAQIAAVFDISRETVYAWAEKHKEFSDAFKKGKQLSEVWYMDLLQGAIIGKLPPGVKFNLGAFCWATKNMFGWTDRVEQEVKTPEKLNYVIKWADESIVSDDKPKPKK